MKVATTYATDADGPVWSSNAWPNAWTDRALDSDTWHLRASVVIPAYQHQVRLEAVLESLAMQTYPSSLFEVIVADDGSEPPLNPAVPASLEARVLRQARREFGLARARNLGAANASGHVVVFLDSDLLPEPQWLEAHMRPHHHCPWMVTVGPRVHVSAREVTADDVRDCRALADLFPEMLGSPRWITEYWQRNDDGRRGHDPWRVTSGGNLGVSVVAFRDVGGFDEDAFTEWGGEDNELGYRLYQAGTMIIPVHEAVTWHLGPGTGEDAGVAERRRRIEIRLASRVAEPALPRMPHLALRTPDAVVEVPEPVTFEEGARFVEQVLADWPSCGILLPPPGTDSDEGPLIDDFFDTDPRVSRGEAWPEPWRYCRYTVRSGVFQWPPGLASYVRTHLGEGTCGALRIDHPEGAMEIWLTRVLGQVSRGLVAEDEAFELVGGLTAPRSWLMSELAKRDGALARERRIDELERQLAELSHRRAIRLADAAGMVAASRSMQDARAATRALRRALSRDARDDPERTEAQASPYGGS
jgi:GT2 family glycosyltransferase